MPFTAEGIRPDLIINPHAIPSRMTIGQLIESLLGKLCASNGSYGDCTAFSTEGSNYDVYGNLLVNYGYHKSGNEILYSGFTGEQIYSNIYIGPTYYMRLKHMVKDKINYRATGKRSALTRQTNQGRANDGGLRIGEMERDSVMGHGLSYFLNESFMVRGDQYKMAICNKTGTVAIYNEDKNLFLSPFADGPLNYNITSKTTSVINSISKFGRSFSVVRIPYALKLLIQELQVMNIQMRIVTEDNIDQLLNLSYQSNNINKLLNITENLTGDEMSKMVKEYAKSSVARNLDKFYKSYAKSTKKTIKSTTQLTKENITIALSENDARFIFPIKQNVNYNKLLTTTVGQYSTSNLTGSTQLVNIIKEYFNNDTDLTITDGTANVGSDTINLAMNFKNVNSFEIDSVNYSALENNVSVFGLTNVKTYFGDITTMLDYGQDVIYIDAPWGGKEYKNANNISLYLSGIEIADFYMRYLDRADLFIFKVPMNYKISNFENAGIALKTMFDMNIRKREFMIGDKPLYLFLIINGNPENKRGGGMATEKGIIFDNPAYEQLFNSLSPENQNKIKSYEDNEKINLIMGKIYEKSQQQQQQQMQTLSMTGGGGIETIISGFPDHIKYSAVGGACNQMAGELESEKNGTEVKIEKKEIDDIPTDLKITKIPGENMSGGSESVNDSSSSTTKKIIF